MPAEFAADGDETLRVAGYTFSIWGLIYLGLLGYAVYQMLQRSRESILTDRMGWASFVALVGITLWIIASAADWKTLTVVLIFVSLLVLVIALLRNAPIIRTLSLRQEDLWLVAWPLGLLGGWLSIATPVNILTVMTAMGSLPEAVAPTTLAILAIVLTGLLALYVTARIHILAFALPVVWGLIGVFVAEHERNTMLGFSALIAAMVIFLVAVIIVFQLRRTT